MLFILYSKNIIFMYKTSIWTHCIDKSTISIPPVLFWHLMSLRQVGQIEILPILANTQLDALFHGFIYFTSLYVSSITVLIIRRSNCINTASGMISLCK